MLKHRTKYDEEVKKNAVKLSYASPKSVRTIAEDLGIAENLLFRAREEARRKIFAYIEGFYNIIRMQKQLGYLSPIQWLSRWYQSLHDCVQQTVRKSVVFPLCNMHEKSKMLCIIF